MDNHKKKYKVIDINKLQEYIGEDKQVMKEFLELFITQSSNDIAIIYKSIKNEDYDEISKQAHKLKSTYACMGIIKAYELLSEIEYLANDDKEYENILTCFEEFLHIQDLAITESKEITG